MFQGFVNESQGRKLAFTNECHNRLCVPCSLDSRAHKEVHACVFLPLQFEAKSCSQIRGRRYFWIGPTHGSVEFSVGLYVGLHFPARWEQLKGVQDFYVKATARIWP